MFPIKLMFPTMKHYVSTDTDGNIHVQNAIMGMMGQHHVHTPADFKRWKRGVPKSAIETLTGCDHCDCGRKPGEVKAVR